MIIRSPEDRSPEVGWKSRRQKSGSPVITVRKYWRSPEDGSPEDGSPEVRSQKSGSPVITISKNRSFGIPGDEATSVVAGLVPATSRIAIP
jgi:hypothetical protein